MSEDSYVSVAKESASAATAVAVEQFRTTLDVDQKDGKTDVVTQADREAQNAAVERIQESFPDATIVAEENETAKTVPDEGMVWVIDPIDGTQNFVRGSRFWATSVSCLIDGEPVAVANYLPAMNDQYVGSPDGVTRNGEPVAVSDWGDTDMFVVVPTIWWDFDRREEYAAATEAIVRRFGDLRRIGSAQAALSMLSAGIYEGVLTNLDTNPWDTVGGAALVRWAGGTVTDLDGNHWTHNSAGMVASNGQAHDEVRAAGKEIEDATDSES